MRASQGDALSGSSDAVHVEDASDSVDGLRRILALAFELTGGETARGLWLLSDCSLVPLIPLSALTALAALADAAMGDECVRVCEWNDSYTSSPAAVTRAMGERRLDVGECLMDVGDGRLDWDAEYLLDLGDCDAPDAPDTPEAETVDEAAVARHASCPDRLWLAWCRAASTPGMGTWSMMLCCCVGVVERELRSAGCWADMERASCTPPVKLVDPLEACCEMLAVVADDGIRDVLLAGEKDGRGDIDALDVGDSAPDRDPTGRGCPGTYPPLLIVGDSALRTGCGRNGLSAGRA
jgi:hypothetical protein